MKYSPDYHDYVFKDGKLVGRFDEMYKYALDVPWHQDKIAFEVFTDIDLAVLKHFDRIYDFHDILDVGCGLGYVTNRLLETLADKPGAAVTGFDISSTAVEKAQAMFSDLDFYTKDILASDLHAYTNRFDLIFIKDMLWYVCGRIDAFMGNVIVMLKDNGCVYIKQTVPDLEEFYGQDVFPTTAAIIRYCDTRFKPVYSATSCETHDKKVFACRYLGRKP